MKKSRNKIGKRRIIKKKLEILTSFFLRLQLFVNRFQFICGTKDNIIVYDFLFDLLYRLNRLVLGISGSKSITDPVEESLNNWQLFSKRFHCFNANLNCTACLVILF